MNAITTSEGAALAPITEQELIEVLQSSLYPGAALPSIKMVLGYCKAAGLDPMRKPVHIVPMWDSKAKQMRDVTMPGIGLYRTDAARTGEHVGTDEPVFGPMVEYDLSGVKVTVPEWCKVTVYRLKQGMKCAYTATEYWIENYATAGKDTSAPNAMWKKRYRGQLSKCAEAQALRKGFPEVGNQPTADEMEGKIIDMGAADVVGAPPPAPPAPAAPTEWPADLFALRLPEWRKAIADKKATVDAIVAKAKSKHALTAEQEAAIRAPITAAAPAANVEDAQVKVTFAMVAAQMNAAKDIDALSAAADLIKQVADEEQRGELDVIFTRRSAELTTD